MADINDTPGTGATPPAGTSFQPAAPLADADTTFTSASADAMGGDTMGATESAASGPTGGADKPSGTDDGTKPSATDQIKTGAQKLVDQAGGHAKQFAEDGKTRAVDALDELSRMIHEAADQVDARLGEQYGQYARQAADQVSRLSDGVKAKQVDDLVDDARQLVGKSPAVAIGVAAALGFVLARVVKAGVDATPPIGTPSSSGVAGSV